MPIFTHLWPSKATSALWSTRAHTLGPFLIGQALLAWFVLLISIVVVAQSMPYQDAWPVTFPEPVAIALLSVLDVWLCMRRRLSPVWSLVEGVVVVIALAFTVIIDGQWLAWHDAKRRHISIMLIVKMVVSALLGVV